MLIEESPKSLFELLSFEVEPFDFPAEVVDVFLGLSFEVGGFLLSLLEDEVGFFVGEGFGFVGSFLGEDEGLFQS